MFPILFRIEAFTLFDTIWGPVELHTYGAMVAIAFALGTWVGARLALQDGVPVENSLDIAFWCLVSGLVGARFMFIIVNARHYANACFHPDLPNLLNNNLPMTEPLCWQVFKLWEGGLVWYGGLLGGILGVVIYLRRHKLGAARVADAVLGAIPLGHFLGRLGCLSAGCCWGRITDSPLGIVFPPNSLPYASHLAKARPEVLFSAPLPIHPTQLYEAVGELSIFLILLAVRYRRRFHGQVALGFLILYPILRSTVELFRGDFSRGLIIEWKTAGELAGIPYTQTVGFSSAQLVSILVAAGALVWMVSLLKKRGRGKV